MQRNDIRWHQRFENFSKAYSFLENSLAIEIPSDTERAGVIQFYEITFELAWKVLKDYLNEEGFTTKSPRETIKLAFQSEYIQSGQLWLEALEDRNLTVHTYDEQVAVEVYNKIKTLYFPLLQDLERWMRLQL